MEGGIQKELLNGIKIEKIRRPKPSDFQLNADDYFTISNCNINLATNFKASFLEPATS